MRDVFEYLFSDSLADPRTESRTFLGTMRRDVTFRNVAERGDWNRWYSRHDIPHLVVECKNTHKLRTDDLRQTACYLGKNMGRFGILATRHTTMDDRRELLNSFVQNDDKYILIINDQDLIELIKRKDAGQDPTSALADKYRALREQAQ